jgi:hypothetical protein
MDSGRSPGVTPEFLPHDASNAFPSGPGWLAANDIVAFYYCGNPDGFVRIIAPFFNAHDSAVRPDEDFRASRDFRGQCQREVNFRSGFELSIHREIYAPRRNIACPATVGFWFSIDWTPDKNWKSQVIPASHATLRHPRCSS